MIVMKTIKFEFTEQDFWATMGKAPISGIEMEQFADAVIEQIEAAINFKAIYKAVKDNY